MIDPRFLWKKIRDTDTDRLKATVRRVSAKTGRPALAVYADLINCIVKYGTGFVDYEAFEMYDMNKKERQDFLTIGRNLQLVRELNDPLYRDLFEDKIKFNRRFDEYIKRDWMVLDGNNADEFSSMLKEKKSLIVKPVDQSCGHGIEKIICEETADPAEVYERLYRNKCILAEEAVRQCAEMDALCRTSINTVRLVTVYNSDDDVAVVAGAIRMGRNGNFVDNFNHGGLAVIIDAADGVSVTDGFDKDRNIYKTVPGTELVLKGFKCPQWEECRQLVIDAAKVVPQVRYVAWDVAVSRDHGPLLIEGNSFPGNDVTQEPKLGLGNYRVISNAIR